MKSESNDTAFSNAVWLISQGEDFTGSTLVITDSVKTYNGNPLDPVTMKLDITSEGPPVEDDILLGDVTRDGEVSIDDVQLTLKAYTERIAGNDMNLTAD